MGQEEDVEGALREIGGKPAECSVPKPKQNSISRSRGSDAKGEWKMAIVYRNMEKIVDLTKGCWGRCFLLVCNGSQLSMFKNSQEGSTH